MNRTEKEFLTYLKINKNYSNYTISSYQRDLDLYFEFLVLNDYDFQNVNTKIIREFMESRLINDDSNGDSKRTLHRRIACLRTFYNFLYSKNLVKSNPFLSIRMKNETNKLPRVLTEEQVDLLFSMNKKRTDEMMIRDQAIMEVLYSSGIRCSELINIKITDIDVRTRTIRVYGKNMKERYVPFSEDAKNSIMEYSKSLRKVLLEKSTKLESKKLLFLNSKGDALTSRGLEYILTTIEKKSVLNFGFSLHPHVFRHTFATRLLDRGADIKIIQELLGHESINTTQIYTHVSKESLISEYNKYFPTSSSKLDEQ